MEWVVRQLRASLTKSQQGFLQVAEELAPTAPHLAAACRQQSHALATMHHRLQVAFADVPDSPAAHRDQLQVAGGPLFDDSLTPQVAERSANQLCALISELRRTKRLLVLATPLVCARPLSAWRLGITRIGLCLVGPGSLDHILSWSRRTARQLLHHAPTTATCELPDALRERDLGAKAVGFACGAGTPVLIWAAAEGVARVAWALGTTKVGAATLVVGFFLRRRLTTTTNTVGTWLVTYFPTEYPRTVDLLLKHTLPWWQGFVAGWNTTRFLWQIVAPTTFPAADSVPVLARPTKVADLNATIVRVGSTFDHFHDRLDVVNGAPQVASATPVRLTLPMLVTMSDELMANWADGQDPSGQASAIRIISVGADPVRFVVVVPGTQSFATTPVRNPYTMTQNLHLMAYGTASNARAVIAAIQTERRRLAIAEDQQVPVLAYGHSQGGIIAAQLARDPEFTREFPVTGVITTGAPIAGRSFPEATTFLAVEHLEDVIPKLDLTENPPLANVVTVTKLIVPFGQRQPVFAVHRWSQYRDTLTAISTSGHPTIASTVAAFAPFFHPVVTVADYPQSSVRARRREHAPHPPGPISVTQVGERTPNATQ